MTTNAPMANANSFDEDMDDDLFDYDIDIGDLDITVPDPVAPPQLVTPGKKDNDILGLDKEVSVRKKRVTVKLDEQRLLSINGLPKLRKEAPKKLKFKGKGHEYKDAARLLSYYQLWADDLFKKAKFRDTLQIIEKLGHTRTIREQREEWIREAINEKRDQSDMRDLHNREEGSSSKGKEKGKEKAADEDSNDDDLYSRPAPKASADPNALFLDGAPDSDEEMDMDNFNDAELEEVLLEAERAKASQTADKGKAPASAPPMRDEYDFDDDMEAMEAMAEFESNEKGKGKTAAPAPVRDEFDDDLEALEAVEAMGELDGGQPGKAKVAPASDEFADEMEAMEAMGAFD